MARFLTSLRKALMHYLLCRLSVTSHLTLHSAAHLHAAECSSNRDHFIRDRLEVSVDIAPRVQQHPETGDTTCKPTNRQNKNRYRCRIFLCSRVPTRRMRVIAHYFSKVACFYTSITIFRQLAREDMHVILKTLSCYVLL